MSNGVVPKSIAITLLLVATLASIVEEVRLDPWGGNYVYRTTLDSPGYKIHSPGVDGIDQSGAGDGIRGAWMEIVREEFDDRSEPDENGMYDFIYTGAYYTFRDGEGQELMFCLYSDTPETACLKQPIEWRPDVYASELFESAVGYLGREEGIKTIEVCDPTPPGRGFIPLEEAIMLADAAGLPVPPAKS